MRSIIDKVIPKHIQYISLMYLFALALYTFFRWLFFLGVQDQLSGNPSLYYYLKSAYLMGLHFDTVIICYLLSLPFFVLSIASFLGSKNFRLYRIAGLFVTVLFILSFLVFAVDIPWFKYNQSRLNVAVLNWVDTPGQMLGIAFSEKIYILNFIGFIVFSCLFALTARFIRKQTISRKSEFDKKHTKVYYLKNSFYLLFFAYLFFWGLRGNSRAPLKQVDACVSNDAVINQIALNPVFTFVKSFSNKISVLEESTAIENTRKYFRAGSSLEYDSPIARLVKCDSIEKRVNVVIILMESMCSANLSRFGNNENITPNIDSLANSGLSFDNIWSAGKHTSNGIYSSLYGYPGIWSQPPTSNLERAVFSGLPVVFQKKNYSTWFFTTHDLSYDNLREFIFPNGFDTAVDVFSYSKEKLAGMYGVSDHIMFERAVQEFSELSENGRSFFSAIVTTSNHGPYVIPAGIPFKPKANPIERQAVEYSDWAIGYFMKLASRQPWFDSTVFIFTADHGANVGLNKFDIPLSFHHIPFIVYCPLIIKSPLADKKLGGQIDIFPTVMGILNQSYINNTFGINLMKDSRPYIYFTEDNKMACLNDTFLYVYSKDKSEQLYLMSNSDAVNIIGKNREKAALMKTYMFSMLQTSQWMIEHKKTGYIPLGR